MNYSVSSPARFILILSMVFVTCQAGFSNEIRNGDFVRGMQGWLVQRADQTSMGAQDIANYCLFEDEGVVIDVRAIEVDADKPGSVVLIQYLGGFAEGADYTLTFEVKIPNGEKAIYGLGMGIQDGPNKGNLGGGVVLTELIGSGEWEEVTAHFQWDPSEAVENAQDGNPGSTSIQFRIGLVSEFGVRRVSLAQ